MTIDFQQMLSVLPLMGKGMLGIFIVTLVIILGVTILNKVTKDKSEK